MPAPLPIRSDRSPAELRRLACHERDGRVSARLMALANALEDIPREETAWLAGMTGQTLADWVHLCVIRQPPGPSCDLGGLAAKRGFDHGWSRKTNVLFLPLERPKRVSD